MPVLRKHEKYCDDVRRLSEAGLSDSEIAEHFGVVTRTVAKWRKRYGKTKTQKGSSKSEESS